MSEWRETTLGEVCELKRGYDLPAASRLDGDVPIVSSSGITGYHSEAKARGPGVVTGRYGTLGEVFFIDEDFWPLNTALYVRDFKGNDPRFVAALLKSLDLGNNDGAAAVPGVNRNQLHRLAVTCPDLGTQRKISIICMSLDDLIDNSRRRTDLLDQMAEAIYWEWFVNFRYPGNEDVELTDSVVGLIPRGWQVRPLGSISTNLDRSRQPLSKARRSQRPGSFPYYGAAKLIDWIDDWIFDGEYLLFAEDGSVQTPSGFPILQLVDRKFWANNHTHVLKGEGVSTRFLFLACAVRPVTGFVTGAAQPKITQANLNRIQLVVGTPSIMTAFDEAVDPIFDEGNRIRASMAPLAAIRDLLLPKLVTGEIDVSSLDLDALLETQ